MFVSLNSLAGCFGTESDPIDIRVTNEDATPRTIVVTVTGDFTPVTGTETVGDGETECLADVIPWLDYSHTISIEVALGEVIVSTTHHTVGDIPSSARPVPLIVTDTGDVSVGISPPSTTAEN